MDLHARTGRRALVGVAMMTAGAVVGIAGLTAPAGAHHSSVEPKPEEGGLSCAELAERNDVDQQWEQHVVDDVADDSFTETVTLDDRGTPDDSDDALVTIEVGRGKTFAWTSTVGIDAIYVQGRDSSMQQNSYFYLYARDADDREATSDEDLGTPPWREYDTNKIKSITFCWDDEHTQPTHPSTTSSSTSSSTTTSSSSTTTSSSTSTSSSTTTSSSVVATSGPTTDTTLPARPGGNLPDTGSNTGMMVAIGAVLLAAGAILVATTRQMWRRHEA